MVQSVIYTVTQLLFLYKHLIKNIQWWYIVYLSCQLMPLTISALFTTGNRGVCIFKFNQIRESIPETSEQIYKIFPQIFFPVKTTLVPKSVRFPKETESIYIYLYIHTYICIYIYIYILNRQLYTVNGWILCYVNSTSTKLFKEKR